MTSLITSSPAPAETLEQLAHRKLAEAVELEEGHPKRGKSIFGAAKIYIAIRDDIDGGIDLSNQFATEQLYLIYLTRITTLNLTRETVEFCVEDVFLPPTSANSNTFIFPPLLLPTDSSVVTAMSNSTFCLPVELVELYIRSTPFDSAEASDIAPSICSKMLFI